MAKRSKTAHDDEQAGKAREKTDQRPGASEVAEPQTRRIAVLGGDGRPHARADVQCDVRYFPSSGNGGNGGARRLESALRAGGIDLVLILTRWNGHEVTRRIRRLCRQLGVPVEISR